MSNHQSQEGEKMNTEIFIENKKQFSEVFEDFKNNPENYKPYFENMKKIDAWIKEEYTS